MCTYVIGGEYTICLANLSRTLKASGLASICTWLVLLQQEKLFGCSSCQATHEEQP